MQLEKKQKNQGAKVISLEAYRWKKLASQVNHYLSDSLGVPDLPEGFKRSLAHLLKEDPWLGANLSKNYSKSKKLRIS
ncbi:MAG: hypothetical protein KDK66_02840 [Deltaproteobacteria bacterium]|nr:hypothetical protein [Deltaproteobacteria bacterium]